MSSLKRKIPKKPKINKVNILHSMLIKPPACTTNKSGKKTKPSTSLVELPINNWQTGVLTQMDPVLTNGGPLDKVITIYRQFDNHHGSFEREFGTGPTVSAAG
uniref:Uncharacterized protein n=1 Tax=Photinus pyralis TaxID=7054 RepID=A0A1Y1K8C9_PHOPY